MNDSLRIVLFGAASAGKSSLLGALVQAAQMHPEALGATLAEPGELTDLHKQTYSNKLERTQSEVVSYPVVFQQDGGKLDATLVDCNGQLANEYLKGEQSLEDKAALAQAVRDADAVLLALDAAVAQNEFEQQFQMFGEFLRLFQEQRSRHADVAGLPVYLVLTKCDLLAQKDDTSSRWLERIEEGKRRADNKLQVFLARAGNQAPFGKIDLHLWATAIRRPALADRAAKANEPFGVAELFRQALDSARGFHEQRTHAHQRLHFVVASLIALIAIMGLVAAGFFLTRPSADVTALEASIRHLLPAQSSAAERLRDPIEDRIKELTKIQNSPHFAKLAPELQDEVRAGREEMTAYQALASQLEKLQPIRFLQKESDIEKNAKLLDSLAVPEPYTDAWSGTRLAKRIEQYRKELASLKNAVAAEQTWIQEQIKQGEKLRDQPIAGAGTKERDKWFQEVDAYLKRQTRYLDTERVPELPAMTYRELYDFQSLRRARDDWAQIKTKLREIRNNLK
ncbi:MAG: GTPase domain-containing protein [Gemmataceae bacterium]|nr:GTPase domain-containing protein [Gemmataceae bacterium]